MLVVWFQGIMVTSGRSHMGYQQLNPLLHGICDYSHNIANLGPLPLNMLVIVLSLLCTLGDLSVVSFSTTQIVHFIIF